MTATLRRPVLALAAAAALLPLAGCGSTPEVEDVPHRDPGSSAGVEAAEDAGNAGMVEGGASAAPASDVPLLRRTEDVNGSPNLYTLVLINDATELPGPVGDALRPDFDDESVIFLGMGRQAGEGYGARITEVRRAGDTLTVAASFSRPAGEAAGEPTTPWSAVVIPKQEGVASPLLSDFE